MKVLNKIFVISIILIPILVFICIKFYQVDKFNIIYNFCFVTSFIFIVFDLIYIILIGVLKIGKGIDRISLFNRKED